LALGGGLEFTHSYFTIRYNELLPARLFPGGNSSLCDTSFLKKGILYYADERNGKPAHPLADIFFITEDKQLVLVGVTGGNDNDMLLANKSKDLVDWINVNGGSMNGFSLHGVVLAPHADSGESEAYNTNIPDSVVDVVRGMRARFKLGGLDQVFEWLE